MSLPLLDYLASSLAQQDDCLQGWACIYVQHILRSNCDCAEFLLRMGLDKRSLRIVGKAYSTSAAALAFYNDNGYVAKDVGNGHDFREPFDDQIKRFLAGEIERLSEDGPSKLLLVDEGGLAVQALASTGLANRFDRLAVAELTARGAQHYHLLENIAPIVDVARSTVKKQVEPPLIAASMVGFLELRIRSLTGRDLSELTVCLVGSGAIGGAVSIKLRELGARTITFDQEAGRSEIGELRPALQEADLVLSSTGTGTDWVPLLAENSRPLIFANCGSSDIEFRPWLLRQAYGGQFRVEDSQKPWRGNIELGSTNRPAVSLVAGGFPVNFDGSPDPIPAHKIQITRAILMAGAIQAVHSNISGCQTLDEGMQGALAEKYRQLIAAGVP